jgi:hypothetical protein
MISRGGSDYVVVAIESDGAGNTVVTLQPQQHESSDMDIEATPELTS